MKGIPREKRYNARGERWCAGCQQYLSPSWFGKHAERSDGLRAYCRTCTNRINRRSKARAYADDARWRERVRRNTALKSARVLAARAEQLAFRQAAVNRLRDQGFSLDELAALSGIDRHTLSGYSAGRDGKLGVRPGRDLERLVLATSDLPIIGRPQTSKRRQPHPDLGLVRARLDRMAYLAELEAAA